MNLANPPDKTPPNVAHKTFHSAVLGGEVGCNVYLPPGYGEDSQRYPVAYHFHGWQGNESSDIWALQKVCENRRAITVFVNAITSPKNSYPDHLRILESMFITELIPHIDGTYRTHATREKRMLSGFSMGGAIAFWYAVKHPELFGAVTPYAGTYHHQFHKDYRGLGEPLEKAAELYDGMIRDKRDFEPGNILCLVRQNADQIRGRLDINMHIGTADILLCDNEILHAHLNALDIPHAYKTFEGVGHELDKIL